jgi:hypothetical protein
MPTDAFTRAVEGLKELDWLSESSDRRRAEIVRAVLGAVREPTDPMDNAGVEAASNHFDGWVDEGQTRAVWQAMIDAILIRDPSIPAVGKLVMDGEGPAGEKG